LDDVIRMIIGTAGALPDVLLPVNIVYCLTGLVVGIIWGALPALSSTMAMALLIGFSAGMPLQGAVIFLLAVYSGSVFGGSISAICINIPGTPAATCTAIEGYPLFRRGEGGQAIGAAILASTIGNLFGAVVLIVCTPFVLALALGIGAWEVFLLGLWGVLLSGSISDAPPLKGWLAGLIGLSIAFVGADSISGEVRYTLGVSSLYGGISFIAVLIGLFGFAEIARGLLFEAEYTGTRVNRVGSGWEQVRSNLSTLFNGSTIGTIIGAIPAAGADVAAFLSYSISRRFASPEQRALYGKGSYRGIVAAESANNASVGGSLLPMFVLAIPGSTVAAAFMGALNLQGIVVGPMIEMSHPGLMEFAFAALLVVSVLMGVVGYLMARPSIALLSVPRNVLLPSIVPICVMGAFAAQNNVIDIYVMTISGIAGIALVLAGIPLAPICMGLILGPLVDLNLRRALLIYQDQDLSTLLTRPIGLALIVVIAVTVIGSMRAGKNPGPAPAGQLLD
jgi:putative tricarboxylic transport membrane protein